MKPRFSLLLAPTILTATLGLPAFAALPAPGIAGGIRSGLCTAVFGAEDISVPLIRVSGDDDDDDDGGHRKRRRHHDHDDDDCDEGDDDDCTGARRGPAPAGTVAPPANGLFRNGAPPRAVTN